jgi:hypothetical protein
MECVSKERKLSFISEFGQFTSRTGDWFPVKELHIIASNQEEAHGCIGIFPMSRLANMDRGLEEVNS